MEVMGKLWMSGGFGGVQIAPRSLDNDPLSALSFWFQSPHGHVSGR